MYWVYNLLILKCRTVVLVMGLVLPIISWGYDPMAPPGAKTAQQPEKIVKKSKKIQPGYTLSQIVIRKNDRKSAVINGYVLNEGGYLKRALVKRIHANKVILSVAGKERVLHLKPKVARVRK